MPAKLQRATGTPTTWRMMGLLVTTIEVTGTSVATIKLDMEGKANLPVGEENSRTRLNHMRERMTQCGHTVGILILPVAAPPKTAQRNTRAGNGWEVVLSAIRKHMEEPHTKLSIKGQQLVAITTAHL